MPKSQESVMSQLSDHANANTDAQEQGENRDGVTQDDTEPVKQTVPREEDDRQDTIDQDLEVKNSQAPAEMRENEAQEIAAQQTEKQEAAQSSDKLQEGAMTEAQEKEVETSAGGQEEEEEEEEEIVIVSYSLTQPEGEQPSGEDVVVSNHVGGQLREDDEEPPRSNLDGIESGSDKVELCPFESVQEEEGEMPELVTAVGEGDGYQRLEAEGPAVVPSDGAAIPDVASEVTSDDIPIPPLPPLPPGVPHPPPPPPPPPGVEVQESWPYPRPKPKYVPNDDSIPSPPPPPLPPGVPPPPPPPPLVFPADSQQPRPKPPQIDQLPELVSIP